MRPGYVRSTAERNGSSPAYQLQPESDGLGVRHIYNSHFLCPIYARSSLPRRMLKLGYHLCSVQPVRGGRGRESSDAPYRRIVFADLAQKV